MKKGTKVRFYTKKEEKRMIQVWKSSTNQAAASRILAREFNRNIGSIQVKLSSLLKRGNTVAKKSDESKGVKLPQGFTFDIKPSRVIMHDDHIRLYF